MAPLIREVVPVMRARVGVLSFVEPTEEIRLLMIQVMRKHSPTAGLDNQSFLAFTTIIYIGSF